MNWEKLKPNHYFKEPVEHIYSSTIFDIKEYDKLYENQNNFSHQIWKDFDEKYKTGFQFCDDLRDINKDKEIICLWFFKERNDRSAGEDIELCGKRLTYFQNTFLMTECKDIKILEKNDEYIRRPLVQLDLKKDIYHKILGKFK
jgi:hypothetical protein